jgi:hypothetical protein
VAALIRSSYGKKLLVEFSRSSLQVQVRLQVIHHAAELTEVERLIAITESMFGTGMHFNQQPIGADHSRSAGEHRDEAADSSGMAWINNHRKV